MSCRRITVGTTWLLFVIFQRRRWIRYVSWSLQTMDIRWLLFLCWAIVSCSSIDQVLCDMIIICFSMGTFNDKWRMCACPVWHDVYLVHVSTRSVPFLFLVTCYVRRGPFLRERQCTIDKKESSEVCRSKERKRNDDIPLRTSRVMSVFVVSNDFGHLRYTDSR